MAILTKTQFVTKYNDASTGQFKDNTSKDITPSRPRSLVQDISDSFSAIHARGPYDLSLAAYPSSGGTGAAGVPGVNDWWYGAPGTSGDFNVEGLGTIELTRGALLIYIGGDPSLPESWIVKQ